MGEPIESAIRQLCDALDHDRAASLAIEAYGAEIERFITGRIRNGADAQDVFALFCEDLWSGLPGFAWRCTLRGWAYTIARHAELRHAASRARHRDRAVTLSDADLLVHTRTTTAPYERTDVKDRFRRIRSRLGEEDELILILRVDRGLGWRDIAQVLATPEEPAASAELQRQEARVRKRFQIIKERLRRWAIDDGLLPAARTA